MPAQQPEPVQHFLFYEPAYQCCFKMLQLIRRQQAEIRIYGIHVRKPQPKDFEVVTFKLFTPVVIERVAGCFFKKEHRNGTGDQFGHLVISSFSTVAQS